MKRFKKFAAVLISATLFAVLALGSGSSSEKTGSSKVGEIESTSKDEVASVESDNATSEEKTAAADNELKEAYYVGDTISYKGVEITYVNSSIYNSNNEFIQPKEGNQFIRIGLHAENKSGSDKSVSTFSFSCYADGYECEQSYNDDELSASLSDGRSADGAVYFEVPADAKDIEIEYEVDIINEKKVKLIFEGDKDSGLTFESNATQSDNAYHVGDIIETKKARISYLNAAEYSSDNMFVTPKDGYKYIYIELEVENISDSDQSISYFSFECYADGKSCDGFYGMDDALSATLSAGRKAKGTVAFEVPREAQTIEIEYEDNFWTENKIIFLYEEKE